MRLFGLGGKAFGISVGGLEHENAASLRGWGLDWAAQNGHALGMLLYNKTRDGRGVGIHLAHAYASGVHVLCCGLPLAAHLLGLSFLTAAGIGVAHLWIHAHEWWFLAFSASVFVIGAMLEWRSRGRMGKKGPSWLLMLTACCLIFNFVVINAHQASAEPQVAAQQHSAFHVAAP